MQPYNKYIDELKTNLKAIDPYMVLLFGSYLCLNNLSLRTPAFQKKFLLKES